MQSRAAVALPDQTVDRADLAQGLIAEVEGVR